ncbi:MAG: hypothetical protein IJ285_04745 [Clostridia bacterium]|nr:hypothetical protein [Oscillospiraceae bacterium]MBQ7960509.1 hypothetical protein [Clostridia bacterium]
MNIHDGHRRRLDRKVREQGLEMLEPHEQLEHILFAVIPRGDTNKIAHNLLKRFVTVAGVLNADFEELLTVEGVGERTAMFLTTLPQLLGVVERSIFEGAPPKLDSLEAIEEFVKTYFYGKLTEAAYIISLNSTYRVLAISKVLEGGQSEIYCYLSKFVKRAVRDNASSVLVVHNHPCGNLNPSVEDVTTSRKLEKAFEAVDIVFADSIIVAEGKALSMRQNGYI